MGGQTALMVAGAASPAEESFGAVLAELQTPVTCIPRDLELFSHPSAHDEYSLEIEIAALLDFADDRELERLHLVGFSGGAGVCLAFAARHPERLHSLALDEPVTGLRLHTEDEDALWREVAAALELDDPIRRAVALTRVLYPPGGSPPSMPSPPPAWVPSRIAGSPVLFRSVREHEVDPAGLERLTCPAYVAYARDTRQVIKDWATGLESLIAEVAVEAFPEGDHLRPPHEAAPDRFATALRQLWDM